MFFFGQAFCRHAAMVAMAALLLCPFSPSASRAAVPTAPETRKAGQPSAAAVKDAKPVPPKAAQKAPALKAVKKAVPAGTGKRKTAPAKAAPGPKAGKKASFPAAPAPSPSASPEPSGSKNSLTFPVSMVSPLPLAQGAGLNVAETWQPLMQRLSTDGVGGQYLRWTFGRLGDSYSHVPMGTKLTELFSIKFIPKPPRKPSTDTSPSPRIYKGMVTPQNVARCKQYLETHDRAFAAMEDRYGVPREIVVGLLMVETRLGTFLGSNSSFWSLACMAAADSPDRVEATVRGFPLPMTPDKDEWLRVVLRERSAWAYKELLALIRHGEANSLDPLGMPGSVYGAIGICQFMPSNLPKYAADGNMDGKIDLFDPADAIFSVGSYLKAHGWTGRDWRVKDRAGHHAVLKRYNKSNVYANTILALADDVTPPPPAEKPAVAAGKPLAKKTGKPVAKTSGAPAAVPAGKSGAAEKSAPADKAPKKKKPAAPQNAVPGKTP